MMVSKKFNPFAECEQIFAKLNSPTSYFALSNKDRLYVGLGKHLKLRKIYSLCYGEKQ